MKFRYWEKLNLQKRLAAVSKQFKKLDKVNRYFFPLEEGEKLSWHDFFWLYGSSAVMIFIVVLTLIKT